LSLLKIPKMNIEKIIREGTIEALKKLYNFEPKVSQVQLQITRKEFEGDITLVIFPFLKFSKKTPEITGTEIGIYLHG
jgi:arginyl-tRNA synthetase